jgi:phage-related minor tail protein
MTGWVNPSYAKVNASLGINSVQERIYRGFKRDQEYFDEVREQFIDKKSELMSLVTGFESEFSNPKEFNTMFDFMNDFYEVLEDEDKFEKTIIAKARTK